MSSSEFEQKGVQNRVNTTDGYPPPWASPSENGCNCFLVVENDGVRASEKNRPRPPVGQRGVNAIVAQKQMQRAKNSCKTGIGGENKNPWVGGILW